jgi:uncharacterized protein (DUF433 family)
MSCVHVLVPHPHVEMVNDQAFIKGSKVPVRRVWNWHRHGVLFTTLLRRYPTLKPAQLLDALSFAYDNTVLINTEIAQEQAQMEDPRPK